MNVYKLTTQQNNLIVPDFDTFRKEYDNYNYAPSHLELQPERKSIRYLRPRMSQQAQRPPAFTVNVEWTSEPWINHHSNQLIFFSTCERTEFKNPATATAGSPRAESVESIQSRFVNELALIANLSPFLHFRRRLIKAGLSLFTLK